MDVCEKCCKISNIGGRGEVTHQCLCGGEKIKNDLPVFVYPADHMLF